MFIFPIKEGNVLFSSGTPLVCLNTPSLSHTLTEKHLHTFLGKLVCLDWGFHGMCQRHRTPCCLTDSLGLSVDAQCNRVLAHSEWPYVHHTDKANDSKCWLLPLWSFCWKSPVICSQKSRKMLCYTEHIWEGIPWKCLEKGRHLPFCIQRILGRLLDEQTVYQHHCGCIDSLPFLMGGLNHSGSATSKLLKAWPEWSSERKREFWEIGVASSLQ